MARLNITAKIEKRQFVTCDQRRRPRQSASSLQLLVTTRTVLISPTKK